MDDRGSRNAKGLDLRRPSTKDFDRGRRRFEEVWFVNPQIEKILILDRQHFDLDSRLHLDNLDLDNRLDLDNCLDISGPPRINLNFKNTSLDSSLDVDSGH
jgi:hypothetical protein